MDRPVIRKITPSDRDWVVDVHREYYRENDGFDDSFGRLVAQIVDDFLSAHDESCEAGWIAENETGRLGCIFCVKQSADTAKLRLFYTTRSARGQGVGRDLLSTCMQFAQSQGYPFMQLWTHESHRAACALYQSFGWQMTASKPVRSFGQDLVEQTWRYQF